jgi:hypothetical protein
VANYHCMQVTTSARLNAMQSDKVNLSRPLHLQGT